ncbi:MAG: hypothetical protein AVDCRST_MAG50-486 [uncultured Acidimicrobiales bacterium]|uniref:Uncharacterized protein n=1 Tax=uncultured Acidimicrobiales bacterium TaxID=310071 RepID=A0A6J4HD89_9ACTN|nr:MAG: hypothetical protein AVDCRST_MAG50-486 [uncultured Acidimicrobiales bacterium]
MGVGRPRLDEPEASIQLGGMVLVKRGEDDGNASLPNWRSTTSRIARWCKPRAHAESAAVAGRRVI